MATNTLGMDPEYARSMGFQQQAVNNQYQAQAAGINGAVYGTTIYGTGVVQSAPPKPKCTSCKQEQTPDCVIKMAVDGTMKCQRLVDMEKAEAKEKVRRHNANKRRLYLRNR